jgi:hypothetical protein
MNSIPAASMALCSLTVRLWREKRGEVEPEGLPDNLIVRLGTVTEHLNRRWYERNAQRVFTR